MKRSTLDLLCCPDCQSDLVLPSAQGDGPVEAGPAKAGFLEAGSLVCSRCERTFPIENGIPRFVDAGALADLDRRFARFYDRLSPVYAFFTKLGFLAFGGDRKARKVVLDRLELRGGRTLEVSIGTGDNLPYLLESADAGKIYGLDISAGQLERCRSLINRRSWPVDLVLGTADVLPFKTGTFDNVLHIGGINFFSHKKRAIGEMIRVARPGSKVVIADESEKIAQNIYRISRLFHPRQEEKVDTRVPVHLVPDTMEEVRVDGIWKSHGTYHGYCLEFRKPGS